MSCGQPRLSSGSNASVHWIGSRLKEGQLQGEDLVTTSSCLYLRSATADNVPRGYQEQAPTRSARREASVCSGEPDQKSLADSQWFKRSQCYLSLGLCFSIGSQYSIYALICMRDQLP